MPAPSSGASSPPRSNDLPSDTLDSDDSDASWYETWFDSDVYPLVYEHRDDEDARRLIDLIVEETHLSPGARVLDVGCGRGRHALLLARRGYDVTGIDLSPASIEDARERAADEGLDVTFTVGDMRDPVAEAAFDGVVNLFTTFGFFEDPDDDQAALDAMAHALRSGGWFVQDYLNAPRVADTLVPESEDVRNGLRIRQTRWIDDGCVHKEIHLDDGEHERTFYERVRLHTRDDLIRMYDAAGLDVTATFGDYDGASHTETAPRLVLVARKR